MHIYLNLVSNNSTLVNLNMGILTTKCFKDHDFLQSNLHWFKTTIMKMKIAYLVWAEISKRNHPKQRK